MGWPSGARAVAEILQVEVLCAEDGFYSIGLESTGDEFGSLGTIRALFVYGNSTRRCGV